MVHGFYTIVQCSDYARKSLHRTHNSCQYEFQCEENEVTTSACGSNRKTNLGHQFEKVHFSSLILLWNRFVYLPKSAVITALAKEKLTHNEKPAKI
jgi:hypothetical protein